MAEYMKVMHIYERMCDKMSCSFCPVGEKKNGHQLNCERFLLSYPEEFEKICLDWDAKNPELTNKAKLYAVLKETFNEQLAQTMLPKISCDVFDCEDMTCDHCCYNGFWDKPYKKEE